MPSRNAIASILNRVGKAFDKKATVGPPPSSRFQASRPDPTPEDDEDDDFESVGLNGVLASTEKLLAVNRGLIPPDERDSAQFKKTFRTHQMLGERIRMDADHLRRTLMFRAAKTRNLSGLHSFYFDPYAEKQLISNSLSTPLEEINPMQLVEQSRRMTLMGPGGLGSANAITEESQALHPSTFGFLSSLEGPECFDAQSEVYTQRGWIPWPEIKDDDVFACRVGGRLEWHPAERVVRAHYQGPLLVAEHETLRMAVTPTHRVLNTRGREYRIDQAQEIYGKSCKVPIRHAPYLGDPSFTHFQLPEIPRGSNAQKSFLPFEIADWCELLGWWLAEGSQTPTGLLRIHQCPVANPEKHARIGDLLYRMGLNGGDLDPEADAFAIHAKQLTSYFKQWTEGCYDKWIPAEFFDAPIHAREVMLEALLLGDGRKNKKRWCYCTVSPRLAQSVERLAISLGYTAFIRLEPDPRPHVKTTNYVVSIHRQLNRQILHKAYPHSSGAVYGDNWTTVDYDGTVYCATVPGGLLHVRGKKSTSGFWSGNSERIGIDTRLAWGTKVGSDGRLYQRFYDRRSGKIHWMSPESLDGLVVKLPD